MKNDNYGFKFRDWDIYNDAVKFRAEVEKIIQRFPKEEQYALIDQTKRALLSIVLNIAEGANKSTDKDMRLYMNRAQCSLDEVVACFDCAFESGYIQKNQCEFVLEKASSLAKRLRGFTKYLTANNNQKSSVISHQSSVKTGFTLMELLLVVGIMAVVFGLALPFALNTKFTNELDAAANNLITGLKEAQSQAIAGESDVPYGIYFDTTTTPQTYTIYKGTSYADRDTSFNAGGYGTTELPKSATITTTSSEIIFARETGKLLPLTNTANKTITLSIADAGSKIITITTEGLIY